ncbi:DUF2017 family protein [Propionicicella superfundia]|uniref:DUF2017 family protein n=1 Tax=Propionicicella superfundia TaxID=348582 RepID=UPI000429B7D0|nr:DUF2017 family protein [Propionicicella superfundia]
MKVFNRVGDMYVTELTSFEVELLFSLLGQLDEIVGVGAAPEGDPLAAMQHEAETERLDRSDPLVGRLFPSAYPDDAEASADFARFTEYEQRTQLAHDLAIVTGGLAGTEDGTLPLQVYADEVVAWLRALSALHLALAARLEIVDEASLERLDLLPEDHPDAFGYEIFEWLGSVMESLLRSVS